MGQRARVLAVVVTVAAAVAMTGPEPAGAADPPTLTVTTTSHELGGPGCSLPEAILVANEDSSVVHDPVGNGTTFATECSPGLGANDVIHLQAGATYVMSAPIDEDVNEMGATGTPVVRSSIIIEGLGAKIVHTGTTPFRAFAVGATGHLDLREVHVKDFFVRGGAGDGGGGGGLGAGGAIYVHDGSLLVQWSTFENNGATGGRGGDRSGGIGGPGGGGGGGLGGDGGWGGGGGGGGGGGARGRGASGDHGNGGGGGGTIRNGGTPGDAFSPRPGGYRCGGAGASNDLVDDDDGANGACAGGGGGGGGEQTGFSGEGGSGAYGGGAGGGAHDVGDGGLGGFGGGGGGASYWTHLACPNDLCGGSGGDGGFGGGAGAGPGRVTGGPGTAGTFGGSATGRDGGGGAGLGGAIFGHSGTVEVRNSTFTGNRVAGGAGGGAGAGTGTGAGGAIFTVAGQLTVTSATIAGNVSLETGAGLVVYKPTTGEATSVALRNTILAGNTGLDQCYLRNGPSASGAANLVVPREGDSLTDCPGISVTSSPNLGALAANGGATPTMAIGTGSAALDAGEVVLTTIDDQRGVARPQGAGYDIGAFEFQPAVDAADVSPPVASPTAAPPPNAAGWNTGDVTVTWGWTDNAGGSGLDPSACTATSTSSGEGAALALGATCADVAGNVATAGRTVSVDKTPPGVVCGTTPTYVVGSTPSTGVTATVNDDLSGAIASPISAAVSAADVAAAGGATKPLTGTDLAGNSTTIGCPYRVGYLFLGFSRPAAGSTVKRGAAVPVAFGLGSATGAPISDAAAAALLTPSCRVQVTLDGAVVGCAKYEAATDTFHYEVKPAKSTPLGAHTVGIRVTEGGTVVNSDSMTITLR